MSSQDTPKHDPVAPDTGSTTSQPPVTPQPATVPAAPASGGGVRTSTVVGALVLILLGAGVAAVGLGAVLDLQASLIVLLIVSGAAVLLGAVLGSRRER